MIREQFGNDFAAGAARDGDTRQKATVQIPKFRNESVPCRDVTLRTRPRDGEDGSASLKKIFSMQRLLIMPVDRYNNRIRFDKIRCIFLRAFRAMTMKDVRIPTFSACIVSGIVLAPPRHGRRAECGAWLLSVGDTWFGRPYLHVTCIDWQNKKKRLPNRLRFILAFY